MKYSLTILLFIFFISTSFSQHKSLPSLKPNFTAIIVQQMDSSLQWYTRNLGFEILNETNLEARGIRQANLQRETAKIELIQLSTAIHPQAILAEKPPRTQIGGFFKFGFAVADFDAWLAWLTEAKVEFHGSVVNDPVTQKRMLIIKDPDGNRIQLFEE